MQFMAKKIVGIAFDADEFCGGVCRRQRKNQATFLSVPMIALVCIAKCISVTVEYAII